MQSISNKQTNNKILRSNKKKSCINTRIQRKHNKLGDKMKYIKLENNKNLLGKKARFKNNLIGYSEHLWLKKGTIKQLKGVEHIGLSIIFDKPIKRHNQDNMPMDSCYIEENSFVLI